ncbi:MAG: hypothetical protein HRT88_15720 [Lentisphaeraceae bacterium]|nr:hypothetical protein [Lentisphaeraceae bacterium]
MRVLLILSLLLLVSCASNEQKERARFISYIYANDISSLNKAFKDGFDINSDCRHVMKLNDKEVFIGAYMDLAARLGRDEIMRMFWRRGAATEYEMVFIRKGETVYEKGNVFYSYATLGRFLTTFDPDGVTLETEKLFCSFLMGIDKDLPMSREQKYFMYGIKGRDQNFSIFHYPEVYDHLELVDYLAVEFPLEKEDENGCTALHYAARHSTEAYEKLISMGARAEHKDHKGNEAWESMPAETAFF